MLWQNRALKLFLKQVHFIIIKVFLAKENFIWLKKLDPFAKLTKEKLGLVLTQTGDVHP